MSIVLLSDCGGGGGSTLAPQTEPVAVPEATSRTCFTPSTQAQSVPLPSAGGFTGKLAIGASSSNASSCDVSVTLSTGTAVATTASNVRRPEADTAAKPILEISLDNAFTNNVIVTGAVLNTPPNLSFPNGTYQAVVTSGTLPPTAYVFTAMNGVLTLVSTGSPIVIVPGTTASLALYAKGVTPPESTPSPSPSASPSIKPSGTPTAAPSATPSPTPTATPTTPPTPTPAPSVGTIVASSITLSPNTPCINTGFTGGTYSFSVSAVTNAPPGTQLEYGWELGGGAGTLSVPPPTMTYSDSYDAGYTVGYANTATVTVPTIPTTYGTNGALSVILLRPPYSYYLDPTPILMANGEETIALVEFEEGLDTCASQGLSTSSASRRRP